MDFGWLVVFILLIGEENMKVIQIMPEFGLAGAEIMCENLSVALTKHRINVVAVSLYDYHSAITDRLEQSGIKVVYLGKRPGLDLRMVKRLYHVFKAEKPDVIHTHRYVMQYAIPAAIMAGIKRRIHTVHSVATKENTRCAQKLNWFFYRFFHVIPVALSKEIQKTVQDRYRLPLHKIPIIFNGIDIDNCIIKKNYEIGDKLKYLHIGRFSSPKNHQMLLKAFAIVHVKIPQTQLTLVGSGDLEPEIRNMVKKLGLMDCVIFAGLKGNVYPILNESDVFLLPSLYEGMPMTLIEAMGTGLPVIATNVGGIPSMIQSNKNGILVNLEVDALADAMLELLDKKKRKRLGTEARKTAESLFSSNMMCEQYLNLYS